MSSFQRVLTVLQLGSIFVAQEEEHFLRSHELYIDEDLSNIPYVLFLLILRAYCFCNTGRVC